MVMIFSANSCFAVLITCPSSGRPAKGCNTLGSCERIRVPLPAARIMTVVDMSKPT